MERPSVWTTLSLAIHADGSSEVDLIGASASPRHWIYDRPGQLVAKSALTDFREWYAKSFGTHTPWGDEDSPALVVMAETALERELSTVIMRGGAKHSLRRVPSGAVLMEQGEAGDELHLVLDGVFKIEVDGDRVAEVGPGAVVGERATLEGGRRSATVRALTNCRVAVATGDRSSGLLLSGWRRDTAGRVQQPHRQTRVMVCSGPRGTSWSSRPAGDDARGQAPLRMAPGPSSPANRAMTCLPAGARGGVPGHVTGDS
ncbi:MAG TPA: cyclic nucleotide-binding domain-containing protein [Acidimicrobiales bacterium]|nr:cyclic nucleotide-binding domain-containing protein [Acidimicrobiales bacterium]